MMYALPFLGMNVIIPYGIYRFELYSGLVKLYLSLFVPTIIMVALVLAVLTLT